MAIAIDYGTYKNTIGRETLTVDATAGGVGFTATNYANVGGYHDAVVALITADGTAPVAATTGHLLKAGDCLIVRGFGNITKFRAIREGGTSATLQVSFFQ